MTTAGWKSRVAAGLAALVACLAVAQLWHVHSRTSHWALTLSSAAPSVVQFEGYTYRRLDHVKMPPDAVLAGQTDDGSEVFKPAADADVASNGIYVVVGHEVWQYGVLGST